MDMLMSMPMGSPKLTEPGAAEELSLEERFAMVVRGLMTDEDTAESSARSFQEASLNEVQGLR
jgi:hypothetical protein